MSDIGVLLAMRGLQEEDFLRQLQSTQRLKVIRRCADAAEVLAAALAGVGDLAVIDAGLGVNRSLLEQLVEAGIVPVVVSSLDDAQAYSTIGASVVHYGIDDLAQQLLQILDTQADRPADRVLPSELNPRSLISVMSAWGSPGRTTVAVNLAAELAARGGNPLLVDADLWGASLKQYLGLDPEGAGIAAAMRAVESGTLDVGGLLRITEERYGIRVLGGLNKSDRWAELSSSAVSRLWELIGSWPGEVVVDAPVRIPGTDEQIHSFGPARNGLWAALAEASDAVCLVTSADTVAIYRCINFHLDAHVPATAVVVNRVRAAAGGPGARQSVEELLARFAGIDNAIFIPDDPIVDKAILQAVPVRELSPRSPAAQGFAEVADRFLPSRNRGRTRLGTRRRRRNGAD